MQNFVSKRIVPSQRAHVLVTQIRIYRSADVTYKYVRDDGRRTRKAPNVRAQHAGYCFFNNSKTIIVTPRSPGDKTSESRVQTRSPSRRTPRNHKMTAVAGAELFISTPLSTFISRLKLLLKFTVEIP